MNLIVFDIDDTLTKSEFQHQSAYVETMKAFGITNINQDWKVYKHYTDSFILKENYENNLTDKFDFSFIGAFENQMTERMLSLKEVTEINGAAKMIGYFSDRTDYALAFATGSLLKPAFVKLNQAGIPYDERLVVGSNEIFEREGIVQKAIEKAGAIHEVKSFEHIISVGDGIWDLKTAHNLGIHFMGIGMQNYADFRQANIKMHIKDWSEFDLLQTEKALGIKNQ